MIKIKNYFKSLFPFRWLYIFLLFSCVEYILFLGTMPIGMHIMNFITWIVVDLTVGVGRKVDSKYGIWLYLLYLLGCITWLLIYYHSITGNYLFC